MKPGCSDGSARSRIAFARRWRWPCPQMKPQWHPATCPGDNHGMDAELWAAIRRLFEVEKLSKAAIAARLRIHRKTVRRALASMQGPPADGRKPACKPGKVDAYEGYLRRRLKEYPELSAAKLLREIQRMGYDGGYTI